MTTCPKCRYVRQATDTAPAWQCPQCGVAYNKVAEAPYVPSAETRRYVPRQESESWGKVAMALFVLVGLYLGIARPWNHPHERAAVIADANAAQPEVILYATSWCPYCAKTREFFRMHQIKYTEYDIEHNAAAAKGYRSVHGNGVPVVLVGEEVIHGYSPDAIAELLQPWMH